jgi:hypothetical protein
MAVYRMKGTSGNEQKRLTAEICGRTAQTYVAGETAPHRATEALYVVRHEGS